jgi:hypothetical protein
MQSAPYLIYQNSSGEPLIQIDPNQTICQESWLKELLRIHPGILSTAEIEPVFSPLIPIGREVATAVGYIDNLFINPQDYPVLVGDRIRSTVVDIPSYINKNPHLAMNVALERHILDEHPSSYKSTEQRVISGS